MRNSLMLLFFLIVSSSFIKSQNTTGLNNSNIVQNSGTNRSITELPVKKTETTGSYYLEQDWLNCSIKLISEEVIENYPVKLNLQDKKIEINLEDEVKTLNLYLVDCFEWEKNGQIEYFENCTKYDKTMTGIFKIAVNKDVKLLEKSNLKLLPATYNVQLDIGSTGDKYIIEKQLYVYSNNSLVELKNSKSSVLKALNDKEEELNTYIKENKIKFKEIDDLIKVINYYNELI